MSQTAYLSLGSNVGDRERNLHSGIEQLQEVGDLVSVSSLYETEPVEYTEQPWFLNCAVGLQTNLTPEKLIAKILEIERKMGRRRSVHKGPRVIDIDVVLFGDQIVATPVLTIPHPGMHQRRFVLDPLAEIAPDARHPVLKKSVGELLTELPMCDAVVRPFLSTEWKKGAAPRQRGSQ